MKTWFVHPSLGLGYEPVVGINSLPTCPHLLNCQRHWDQGFYEHFQKENKMPDVAATPTTVLHGGASLIGALVVYFGPQLGPWIAVFVAAVVGSLWTVGKVETSTRLSAGLVWIRTILTACILTGGIAVLMGSYVHASLDYTLPITAFLLGAIGDKFESLRIAAVARIQSWIGGDNK
jgi:hypothetical protein